MQILQILVRVSDLRSQGGRHKHAYLSALRD
jgi:hypothetical protein